jgi:hypothetical protein
VVDAEPGIKIAADPGVQVTTADAAAGGMSRRAAGPDGPEARGYWV